MGRSRFGWALGVVAPWCLGVGMVVSFTADAGQDASLGASMAPMAFRAITAPLDLIPASNAGLPVDPFGLSAARSGKLLQQARLELGEPEEFRARPDELEPRVDLKKQVRNFPQIDRTKKGDPVVGLRPTFDAKLRNKGGLTAQRATQALFGHDESGLTGGFNPQLAPEGPEVVSSFEPWAEGESPTTRPSSAAASPGQGGSAQTWRPEAIQQRDMQGATPAVPRATTFASATPAPADYIPVEIVSLPSGKQPTATANSARKQQNFTTAVRTAKPNYAALIGTERAAQEKKCLAEAIYFESRSEPEAGQAAVAQVILNRAGSGLYPTTICGVVYQNRHRHMACQFSFACEGKSLRITDQNSWGTAVRIAEDVTQGKTYLSDVGASTHYHANYVRPRWAKRLKKMDTIGHHIFYTLKPGQT